MIDHMDRTGSRDYLYVIAATYEGSRWKQGSNFTNDFIDDTGWWGLAWVRAYDFTGNRWYLDMAKKDADHMARNWDETCGGGVWWKTESKNKINNDPTKYDTSDNKSAIQNELFLALTASLHNRVPGDLEYLSWANRTWDWFLLSGMITEQHLVTNGPPVRFCQYNGGDLSGMIFTYNQGVVVGGLVELYRATVDANRRDSLIATAQQIADAATTAPMLVKNGILTEQCEARPPCGTDGESFKGSFVRNLYALWKATGKTAYREFINRQADIIWTKDRNSLNQFGLRWAGPLDAPNFRVQQSAQDALNAAIK